MIDVKDYVTYMIDENLTEHQILILWLVHTKNANLIGQYKKKFGQFDVDQILDLINRGYIEDFGLVKDNKREFDIYNFIVGDKFSNSIYIDEYEAGEQLISTYPSFLVINGTTISAKSCDHDDLAIKYAKIIKNNRKKHERILELVKMMSTDNNGKAVMGVEKFVASRHWNLLEEQFEGMNLNDTEDDFITVK